MSRFRLFQYVGSSFLVAAAAGAAYKIKPSDIRELEIEKSPELKRLENFNQHKERHYSSAHSASLRAPVMPEIREFSLEQLIERLNFWQNSTLSAAELYQQATEMRFHPHRTEDYQDCIIAFMQLREFCNKYETRNEELIRPR